MDIEENVGLSETVDVAVNQPLPGQDALAGKAVKVCIVCGNVLCDAYPVTEPVAVTACHGDQYVREDYAPSVVLDGPAWKLKRERIAVRGEPMDHVRARLKG